MNDNDTNNLNPDREFEDHKLSEREKNFKAYTLPLAPQDLVAIYKQKEEDKDFILYVDYYQTKQKLSPKHIIIYLANTNFKAGFTFLDEELITEYIKSDFMIDCPILVRMVSIIVRMRLHYDINGAEKKLTILFPEEKIHQFIEQNIELVDELIETIRDSVPWAMVNLHENLTDEAKKEEKELTNFINNIDVYDKPSNCGPNVARFITEAWDGFLCIIHNKGVSSTYNKTVYNEQPKYFGKDLYYIMNETRVIDQIMALFPAWFWAKIETVDINALLEETEGEHIDKFVDGLEDKFNDSPSK
jgi:hypothetical protein